MPIIWQKVMKLKVTKNTRPRMSSLAVSLKMVISGDSKLSGASYVKL